MEESEQRRERLKAMRMEAAQTKVSDTDDTFAMPGVLSNPLVEGSATLPVQENSCATPRFDFYTDPMAAFSSNKRRINQSQQDYLSPPPSNSGYMATMARMSSSLSGPRNCEMTTPFPYLPFQPNFSPAQGINQAQQGLYHSSGTYGSPTEMASPFPAHQVTPGVWNGPRYGTPPNSSRGSNIPNNGFRLVGSPSFSPGRGRGHWHSNSPSPVSGRGGSSTPNSGRGKNGWFGSSTSPSSGRGRGRGRGHVSAQYRPELFYKKSMVEDPWKFLKPVIWRREEVSGKTENTVDSPKSWLPKSISMKRPRVSEATNESSSQQSLAEYLAASFNEAVNDTSG